MTGPRESEGLFRSIFGDRQSAYDKWVNERRAALTGADQPTVKLSKDNARALAEQMVSSAYASSGETPSTSAGSNYNDLIANAMEQLQKGTSPEAVAGYVRQVVNPGNKPDASIGRLGTTPPAANGQANSAPAGYEWAYFTDPVTGITSAQLVKIGTGRSAGEEAASAASANANNAQAAKIYADMARDAMIQSAIDAGELRKTQIDGVYFTPDGKVLDKNAIDAVKAQTAIQQGTLNETMRKNLISEGIERQRVGIDQQRADQELRGIEQTGAYQQGQLTNDRERLNIDRGRLSLETQKAEAEIRGEQQRNSLARQQYIGKILSGPTDFIARGVAQRGGEPGGRITNADLINQLNNEFAGLQPGQTLAQPAIGAPELLGQAPPQLANGGTVNDRLMIVGDTQHSGQGAGNPEYVVNPTGAPIAVVPMNRLGMQGAKGYANGTAEGSNSQPAKDPAQVEAEQRVKSIGRLLQFVESPETQHALVDELAEARGRLGGGKPTAQDVPAYAYGTTGGSLGTAKGTEPAWITQQEGLDFLGKSVAPGESHGVGTGNYPTPGFKLAPPLPSVPPTTWQNYSGSSNDPLVGVDYVRGKGYARFVPQSMTTGVLDANGFNQLGPRANSLPVETQESINATADAGMRKLGLDRLFGQSFGQELPTQETTPNPLDRGGVRNIRFPFGLFSPQQLQELTNDELKALNSYLGVRYNTTLDDVITAQQQRFVGENGRSGRLVR